MSKPRKARESVFAQASVVLNASLVFFSLFVMLKGRGDQAQIYVLMLSCSMTGGLGSLFDLGSKNWVTVAAKGRLSFADHPSFQKQLRRVTIAALVGGCGISVYAWLILHLDGFYEWRFLAVFLIGEIITEGLFRSNQGLLESAQHYYLSRTIEIFGRLLHLIFCVLSVRIDGAPYLIGLAFLGPAIIKFLLVKGYVRRLGKNYSGLRTDYENKLDSILDFAILNAMGVIHSVFIKFASALLFGLEVLVVVEVSLRIYSMMNLFSQSISSILLPKFSYLVATNKENRPVSLTENETIIRFDRFVTRSILTSSILVLIWLDRILILFLAPPITTAKVTTLLLILMPVVSAHNHIWVYILQASNQVEIVRKIQSKILAMSVILSTAFGWLYGSIGFASGFLIGVIFGVGLYSSAILRYFPASSGSLPSDRIASLLRTFRAIKNNVLLYVGVLAATAASIATLNTLPIVILVSFILTGLASLEFVRITRYF